MTLLPKIPGLFALDDMYIDPLDVRALHLQNGTLSIYVGDAVLDLKAEGRGESIAAAGAGSDSNRFESYTAPMTFSMGAGYRFPCFTLAGVSPETFSQMARDLAEAKLIARGLKIQP